MPEEYEYLSFLRSIVSGFRGLMSLDLLEPIMLKNVEV